MATSEVLSKKNTKRMESRKSHSWWWDSHISPKNSKWLSENLEEMDHSVKRMLKLIEEDGDSFAKKAEMYYQKRPELISHVEEFYRMYRSLAERYDHVTGELRKSIPSDLQSQGSGISEIGSEPPSPSPWFSPEHKISRRRSGPRAAGFNFFLGNGGNGSDNYQREGDESSTLTDSDSESDVSSVNNYSSPSGNAGDQDMTRKIIELEIELRDAKEKLQMKQEDNAQISLKGVTEDFLARVAGYEQELRKANEKLQISEDKISNLRTELQRYRSLESETLQTELGSSSAEEDLKNGGAHLDLEGSEVKEVILSDSMTKSLVEELRITKERLGDSERQISTLRQESSKYCERIHQLQDQLAVAQKEIATWKAKFNTEKRETAKLQERIARLKSSLSDRDHEIRDLKAAVSDAEQKIFPEKLQLKAEMSKVLEERAHLGEQIREWECRGRSFEEEIRKMSSEKAEMEDRFKGKIEDLKAEIMNRDKQVKDLSISLDTLKSEKDSLMAEMLALKGEMITKDNKMSQLDKHLNQLHLKHVHLIAGMEGAHIRVEELKSRVKELEEEIEKQKVVILEGAEEKREVIRQLCFSLEHYRDGYNMLRQAFNGHKRVPVLAA